MDDTALIGEEECRVQIKGGKSFIGPSTKAFLYKRRGKKALRAAVKSSYQDQHTAPPRRVVQSSSLFDFSLFPHSQSFHFR